MPCNCGVCQECDWARNHEDESSPLELEDRIASLESALAAANERAESASHKAEQYDAVVKTLHVCDGGRYRNDWSRSWPEMTNV